MKTTSVKHQDVEREWHVVDLEGQTLGRVATQIATILRGKHKPTFTPHVDTGDFVVVVNAERVVLTGNKLQSKQYYRHSQHPGGLRSTNAADMLEKSPEHLITAAVKGMLPKNPLGRKMLSKLKVFAGPDHTHEAQQPKTLVLS